jgi:ATP adenylyltransferase
MDHLWTTWRMPYLQGSSNSSECIFCAKIGADDAAEHILYRGGRCYVTLNLYPYNNGHMMVVPYQHVSGLEELDAAALTDLMVTTQMALHVLREAYHPQAFNIGINQGAAAGAGIAAHLHQHIVPRWGGDTNYMTIIGQTRVIPEWVDDTYAVLKSLWRKLYPSDTP